MRKFKLFFDKQSNPKGQSFLELAIVLLFLVPLLFGMIEFGNLLNQYITLTDGAREGARWASNADPISNNREKEGEFYAGIQAIIEGDPNNPTDSSAIHPLALDGGADDLVVSYYSVEQGTQSATLQGTRSLHSHKTSIVTASIISENINANAPSTGLVVVEIFYRYRQIFTFLDYDIDLHVYAIMPLSALEPTPT